MLKLEHVDHQFGWQIRAECKGIPSYIFFADESRPEPKKDPYAGKTYEDWCEACPVMWTCRQFAQLHDLEGIWGNLSFSERSDAHSGEDRKELREYKGETGEYWPLYGHS